MFNLATSIAIEDNRFCGYFKGIIEVMETGSQIDSLNIRLTLRGRVGKGGSPHAIEFTLLTIHLYLSMFCYEASKTIVTFKNTYNRFSCNKATERRKTHLRSYTKSINLLFDTRSRDVLGVRNLDNLTTQLFHYLEYLITDILVRTNLPIVTMNDVIRLVLKEIRDIAPIILRDHP